MRGGVGDGRRADGLLLKRGLRSGMGDPVAVRASFILQLVRLDDGGVSGSAVTCSWS
jgi:hypothetical protein